MGEPSDLLISGADLIRAKAPVYAPEDFMKLKIENTKPPAAKTQHSAISSPNNTGCRDIQFRLDLLVEAAMVCIIFAER
jgi:hypothetical protein